MKLALVFPPLADPSAPHASLPCLTAFLRNRGNHTVTQIDANVDFFFETLTRPNLVEAKCRVEDRLDRLERKTALDQNDAAWYARAIQSLLRAPFVIDRVHQALTALSAIETFSSLRRLNRAKRTVLEAAELISCAWAPLSLAPDNAKGLHFGTPAEVARWVVDSRNPFRAFLARDTMASIGDADAVGISISYRNQILPAFTLTHSIRECLPNATVIFGGNLPSVWYETIEACPDLFDWCDYLVAFEGETALDALLTGLANGSPLDSVPNIAYRRAGRITKTHLHQEQLSRLPTPDYDGLPLRRYLSPEPVLSVYATRGCYWSRCGFCSVSPSLRGHFASRDPALIHRDIMTMGDRFDTRCFTFCDDCVPTETLSSLSSLLIEQGPKVSWQCEARFERSLNEVLLKKLKRAGCVNLTFGLESYSERVLKRMGKGIHPDRIERVLRDCEAASVAVNLQFFFGFPKETEEDAEITYRFIEQQAHGSATFSFGVFELHRGSNVSRHPEHYGIRIRQADKPLSVCLDFEPELKHAAIYRRRLRRLLRDRMSAHHAGLSLNAHTLVFLAVAGVEALSDLYRPAIRAAPKWDDRRADTTLVRSAFQQLRCFAFSPETLADANVETTHLPEQGRPVNLLYDYDSDRMVEVSPLAVTILEQLRQGATLSDIARSLGAGLDEAEARQSLGRLLESIAKALYERGFLVEGGASGAPCVSDG